MSKVSRGKLRHLCALYGVDRKTANRLDSGYLAALGRWSKLIKEALAAKPILGVRPQAADTGFYSGVRRLQNDLDTELMIYITRTKSDAGYFELQRGRHRSIDSADYFPISEYSVKPLDGSDELQQGC